MREYIKLECSECKSRNYVTTKNRRTHPKRIEFNKYCPVCKKHTVHKEKR
ncbi:MAG: 50S ribosomal protein L33 [Candidatus Cloacimonetes bacterium]|nr:50S ribosomal protein L33 [Candidatus Cloacimonadota bacterium]MBS3766901.1 50S ribosomal protein L33 [Candidatus Cloacimonadota bacterium]